MDRGDSIATSGGLSRFSVEMGKEGNKVGEWKEEC